MESLKREVQIVKNSTKLILTGAATVLGVALATGGAFAATGSLDAAGQVLETSSVAPAATHANAHAQIHANANARGLVGTDASSRADVNESGDANASDTTGEFKETKTASPVSPSIASKDASTVKGRLTGEEISAWAHEQASVHVVTPEEGISVEADAKANVHAQH
jgi:hypothetical protein